MITLDLNTVAQAINGELIGENKTISVVSTDSRYSCENGLFFALKGEHFDAHQYLDKAIEQGAVAVVVQQADMSLSVPQIVVADTRLALGLLAKWLKQQIKPLTVAMTGSSGKTTVKEMAAAILQNTAGEPDLVLFTHGNFNNDIGVPLILLRLTQQHKFAVIELGANHQGEIAYTTNLVQPDVALVNNVAAAHLEGFGSIEGVAKAKGEIYLGLQPNGVALVNWDCHYLDSEWRAPIGQHEVRSFSAKHSQADFYAKDIHYTEQGANFILCTPQGEIAIHLPYLGEHNVSNAVAAAALTTYVGATLPQIKAGLERKSQVKGRLFPIEPCENLLLLDDTYNANVDSLLSAIRVLQKYSAFRIFVVGDMAELGENSKLCHQEVANFAADNPLDMVVSFGEESAVISASCQGQHFTDKSQLVAYLEPIIQQKLEHNQKVVVLAKGSRRMQMETVIDKLKDRFSC
ncbi:UDP-N-acetylmuramoyl-tripeptide--D-alanyl-D-alanine ligase [Conservatibacter flavescens]|uniref:UDP-N-acetylmuramoyl-tripeptide--D-alanyl-D-alanine ligase n=1 Tax=Conservatibacter flavescens TaxID=28161 RepID=A0A2M8S346_9PAST|nr:UDP-N-acetylmuramoyl-tripeptide--D-alanyl-D-alanine ligase [Conservatibacter flavescens]PJG85570.1 UDP-N-acetylmuramoyl-tripeptide--D-alanyl-D-alanine ligase [Conservatibacter flavescens]